jgi:hypothetical protein
VLVGDRDGVVVIPRALAPEIAGPALEQEQLEGYLNERVKAGEPLWGIYPPSEQTLAEYRAATASPGDGSSGHRRDGDVDEGSAAKPGHA